MFRSSESVSVGKGIAEPDLPSEHGEEPSEIRPASKPAFSTAKAVVESPPVGMQPKRKPTLAEEVIAKGIAKELPGQVGRTEEWKRVARKKLAPQNFSHVEERPEFVTLEYTPSTIDNPIDMRYPLRVTRLQRKIHLATCITVGATDTGDMVLDTLRAVNESSRDLQKHSGLEWQDVLTIIVVDGVDLMTETLVDLLQTELRLFDPSLLEETLREKPVRMHLFERTVELAKHKQSREFYDPMQIALAVKDRQRGRMQSLLWFFSGYCQHLKPIYAMSMVAGATPEGRSLSTLVNCMERNRQIACVQPEIQVKRLNLFNPVHASQFFAYKMESVLSLPSFSLTGYLPAPSSEFMAYRYSAMVGAPLGAYFETQEMSVNEMGPIRCNRHVRPEQVLSEAILTKAKSRWTMHYESAATVSVPAPTSVLEFLDQRRRWQNGHLFNTLHFLFHAPPKLLRGSRHTPLRFIMLGFQYLYQMVSTVVSWFSVAITYLVFSIIARMALIEESEFDLGRGCVYTLNLVFMALTVGQVVADLGADIRDLRVVYWVSAASFSAMFVLMGVMGAWLTLNDHISQPVMLAAGSVFGCLVLAFLIHLQLYSAVRSFLQFLLVLPLHIIIAPIHAVSSLNNVSHRRHVDIDPWDPQTHALLVEGPTTLPSNPSPSLLDSIEVNNAMNFFRDGKARMGAMALTTALADVADDAKQRQYEYQGRIGAVARRFARFRTRMLGLWMATNWMFVTFFLYFGLEEAFTLGTSLAVIYQVAYLFLGSVLYRALAFLQLVFRCMGCRCCRTPAQHEKHRSGGSCWSCCGRCCGHIRPSWHTDDRADDRSSPVGSHRSGARGKSSPNAPAGNGEHGIRHKGSSVLPMPPDVAGPRGKSRASGGYVSPEPLTHPPPRTQDDIDAAEAKDAEARGRRSGVQGSDSVSGSDGSGSPDRDPISPPGARLRRDSSSSFGALKVDTRNRSHSMGVSPSRQHTKAVASRNSGPAAVSPRRRPADREWGGERSESKRRLQPSGSSHTSLKHEPSRRSLSSRHLAKGVSSRELDRHRSGHSFDDRGSRRDLGTGRGRSQKSREFHQDQEYSLGRDRDGKRHDPALPRYPTGSSQAPKPKPPGRQRSSLRPLRIPSDEDIQAARASLIVQGDVASTFSIAAGSGAAVTGAHSDIYGQGESGGAPIAYAQLGAERHPQMGHHSHSGPREEFVAHSPSRYPGHPSGEPHMGPSYGPIRGASNASGHPHYEDSEFVMSRSPPRPHASGGDRGRYSHDALHAAGRDILFGPSTPRRESAPAPYDLGTPRSMGRTGIVSHMAPPGPHMYGHQFASPGYPPDNQQSEFDEALRRAAEFGLGRGVDPAMPLDSFLQATRGTGTPRTDGFRPGSGWN